MRVRGPRQVIRGGARRRDVSAWSSAANGGIGVFDGPWHRKPRDLRLPDYHRPTAKASAAATGRSPGRVWLAPYKPGDVVPPGTIVLVAVVSMRKLALGDRASRVLKGISGALLVAFGLVFLIRPDLFR